jgi:hypothetical protein
MTFCTVRDNGAPDGGGIFNSGWMNIEGSTITSNAATGAFGGAQGGRGGGIYNAEGGVCNVNSSTIGGNTARIPAGQGGGVYNQGAYYQNGGSLSGNGANGPGSRGGGIYNKGSGATVSFINVSIVGNGADWGGGFYLESGALWLEGCFIGGNFASPNQGNGGAYTPSAIILYGPGNEIWDEIVLDD